MSKWSLHERTTEEQARANRGRSNNGKRGISAVENTSPLYDDYDVNIGLAGSGMVYDAARPNKRTSRSSECSHGGHDGCICGMAESRKEG